MRIAIVSDACDPPTNGVSRTIGMLQHWLPRLGHEVNVIEPPQFRTVRCPTEPDIRLAVRPLGRLTRMLDAYRPDAIHVATEGPLGLAARRYCVKRGYPFTTMFTTKFPEAIHHCIGVPVAWTYAALRWFHARVAALMVTTQSLRDELRVRGFQRLVSWSRGVDTELFRPRPHARLDLPRPIFLYVGRIVPEKSVEDFLRLELPGTKVLVGAGGLLPRLRERYPEAVFLGVRRGEELAEIYAAADAFVFPSRTETFGLVVLEALASGLPVAAYPVTGPRDVIAGQPVGVLDTDLRRAALAALDIPRDCCRAFALGHSWEHCAREFVTLLHPIGGAMPHKASPVAQMAGSPGAAGNKARS